MATVQTIVQMNDSQVDEMIKLLAHLDKHIDKRIQYVMRNMQLSKSQSLEFVVTDNPILWAKVYLDWESRDYQHAIITEGKKSKKLVLRLGRRLGKSDSICVLILWFAYTQYNKGPNNQYDILIATPYETQIDLIFKRLHQLIDQSALMQSVLIRDVHHHLEFKIGDVTSTVLGFTAGANNASGGANNTRGQRADRRLDQMNITVQSISA